MLEDERFLFCHLEAKVLIESKHFKVIRSLLLKSSKYLSSEESNSTQILKGIWILL